MLNRVLVLVGVERRLLPTVRRHELLQLLDAQLLGLHGLLQVLRNLVVCLQLLLQLDYGLVPLVEAARQRHHDLPLLEQQLLVPIQLGLALLELVALSLDLAELDLVFLADDSLLLLESGPELRGVLDHFTASQHLRVHRFDLFLKQALLLLGLHELARPVL